MKLKVIMIFVLISIIFPGCTSMNNNTSRQSFNDAKNTTTSTVANSYQTTKSTTPEQATDSTVNNLKTTEPATTNSSATTEPTTTSSSTTIEQTTSNNYSIYTGDWVCKHKKTSLNLNVDSSGNVSGSITTVVGSQVPSSMISGTIKNNVLTSKLDDGDGCTGMLILSFANPQIINGTVKLDKSNQSGSKLAEGDMSFEKYQR